MTEKLLLVCIGHFIAYFIGYKVGLHHCFCILKAELEEYKKGKK